MGELLAVPPFRRFFHLPQFRLPGCITEIIGGNWLLLAIFPTKSFAILPHVIIALMLAFWDSFEISLTKTVSSSKLLETLLLLGTCFL